MKKAASKSELIPNRTKFTANDIANIANKIANIDETFEKVDTKPVSVALPEIVRHIKLELKDLGIIKDEKILFENINDVNQ